jgi:ribonuclease PH
VIPRSPAGFWRAHPDLHPAGALDVISVLLGVLVLTVGTLSCAVAGAWVALVTLLPIGTSLLLVPRRGAVEETRGS